MFFDLRQQLRERRLLLRGQRQVRSAGKYRRWQVRHRRSRRPIAGLTWIVDDRCEVPGCVCV